MICNFKNGQKSIFELGKSLKLSKMQFHEILRNVHGHGKCFRKNHEIDFTSLDFFKISGPHSVEIKQIYLKGLKFHYVSEMSEVLNLAILNQDVKNAKSFNRT